MNTNDDDSIGQRFRKEDKIPNEDKDESDRKTQVESMIKVAEIDYNDEIHHHIFSQNVSIYLFIYIDTNNSGLKLPLISRAFWANISTTKFQKGNILGISRI